MPIAPATAPKRLAVVGAGPAGLAFAVNAASRGHQVTLFDGHREIGGQFNIAKQIPGKEEFTKRCVITAGCWILPASLRLKPW
jgi:2,4-dienoyl-CoA reductase (NADPH2)